MSTTADATAIALFGAAGHMGTRLSTALAAETAYRLLFVEAGAAGQARLQARGLPLTPATVAAAQADVVILAVPDTHIGAVAQEIVPLLRSGVLLICLDPAAPYAGLLPARPDVSYFVTHPSHPPIFNDETDVEARQDYFGSGKARQTIVNALVQGPEADYARGEAIARAMFAPILRSHRVTLAQMAILEPVLSETVAATCLTVIREAMDEAIRRGVPEAAARDFLLGHFTVEIAILFNAIDWHFSAGAQVAIEAAKKVLFQPDWKQVFEPERLRESVLAITGA
jgi:hypothetical protein